MNSDQIELEKKYSFDKDSKSFSKSNINFNNKDAIVNANKNNENESVTEKKTNKKKAKNNKKMLDSHDLVQKSLKEVASLYRTSALIEICIFILLEFILASYYLYEINVPKLYETNSGIKSEKLKFKNNVFENFKSIDYDDRIRQIIHHTFDLKYYKVIRN